MEFNNGSGVRRMPITRNNMFYSMEDFNFEIMMGKQYIEEDMNQTVILYQVDLNKTNVDSLYGETDAASTVYKAPVEVPCVYEIEEPELKSYDKTKNLGTYMKTGKLKVGVYQETLDELGVDIKKGDTIAVQINEYHLEQFEVINDGKNNYDNNHSLFGVKPLYRSITCAPVDQTTITL